MMFGDYLDTSSMSWEAVTEQSVNAAPDDLAFVEAVKRYPGPKGRSYPVYIVCRDRHKTGLSVSLGTREDEIVITFRAKSTKGLEVTTGSVAVLNADGPMGHGAADRSTGLRMICPLCFGGTAGGAKPPEWIVEEAIRRLKQGVKAYQKTGRWPLLHLSWT